MLCLSVIKRGLGNATQIVDITGPGKLNFESGLATIDGD